MNDFLKRMNEDIEDFSSKEKETIMGFLTKNFDIIEKFIEAHKKTNLQEKVYDRLAKNILETEPSLKDYKINGDNLSKYISKIRKIKNDKSKTKVKKEKK